MEERREKKNLIPDYKILKMLSKDDIFHHATSLFNKNIPKVKSTTNLF